MKGTKWITGLLAVVMSLMVTACGAPAENAAPSEGSWNYGAASGGVSRVETEEFVPGSPGMNQSDNSGAGQVQESDAASQTSDRKLIRTVNMSVETREFDSVMDTLERRIVELGGYMESLETYNGSAYSNYRSNRSASMTARIPADQFNGFLGEVSGISNVTRRSENVQDVTLDYVDLDSHKKTLQAEHDRLLELIEQAGSIEDIITIEQRLSNVRYQIESMEAQLRTYDNKVEFSTLYLDVSEVQELTPVQEETLWERISGGFMEDLQRIGNGGMEILVWLLVHIPTLALWAALITLFVFWVRWYMKRSSRKADMMGQKAANAAAATGPTAFGHAQATRSGVPATGNAGTMGNGAAAGNAGTMGSGAAAGNAGTMGNGAASAGNAGTMGNGAAAAGNVGTMGNGAAAAGNTGSGASAGNAERTGNAVVGSVPSGNEDTKRKEERTHE